MKQVFFSPALKLTGLAELADQTNPQDPPVSYLGLVLQHTAVPSFLGPRIQIQVFVLAQKALYWVTHLPRP